MPLIPFSSEAAQVFFQAMSQLHVRKRSWHASHASDRWLSAGKKAKGPENACQQMLARREP